MLKLTALILVFFQFNAFGTWLPNIKFYSNKLVDAWDNNSYADDINDFPPEEEVILLDGHSYEEVAKWRPRQLGFYYRHMKHLLNDGVDPKKNTFTKVLGGVGFLTGYVYRVDPAFFEGYFTRVDSYKVKPAFNVKGTILDKSDYLLQSKLTPGYEMEYTFYRHFKDPKKALALKPYLHQNLPFDSEHARKGMKAGDIFRFRTKLNLVFDTSALSKLVPSPVGLSAGALVGASGMFDVFIIRHADNVVQLKVMGGKQHKLGVTAMAGVDTFYLSQALETSLVKTLNQGMILDYLVNLNDSAVSQAFDETLLKIREFGYMGMVDPRDFTGKEFYHDINLNFAPLEKVLNSGNENIVSEFKGSDKAHGSDFKIGFGTESNFLSFRHHSQKNTNNFENDGKHYVLKTKREKSGLSFLFSLSEIERTNRVSTLSQGERPLALVFASERTDRRFSQNDLKKSLKEIRRLYPYAYENLDLDLVQGKDLGAVDVRTLGIVTMDALSYLPKLTRKEIITQYRNYLSDKDLKDILVARSGVSKEEMLLKRLTFIAAKLEKVMGNAKLEDKLQILSSMSGQSLFRATGMGFLMSLLSDVNRRDFTRTEIHLSSSKGPKLTYVEGIEGPRKLYSDLVHYDNLINSDELELRLILDSLLNPET